jgi:hypothetical protein
MDLPLYVRLSAKDPSSFSLSSVVIGNTIGIVWFDTPSKNRRSR